MTSRLIDHQATGRSLVATQYTQSPRFLAWLRALLEKCDSIEKLFQKIAIQSDIDEAEGVNLDVIGDIVGVNRIVPDAVALQFFGFEGQPAADTFGEEGRLTVGSRFREESETNTTSTVLYDPEYRLLIRAKIIKNHSIGTNDDILRCLDFLFDTEHNVVEDIGGMFIGIGIGRELTFTEKVIIKTLDILPRPSGVRIDWRSSFNAERYFGFEGQPGALPFGEEEMPEIGGYFSEEF
jgi:hypothetical protein